MRQLSLLQTEEEINEQWTSDDWETPDHIARAIASLVREHETVIEPSAGNGQIAKYLPSSSNCIEIKKTRCDRGRLNAPHCLWTNGSFLDLALPTAYDAVVGNPPFSLALDFIRKGLKILDPSNPEARILFLLPIDWNCGKARGDAWRKTNAHIFAEYRIQSRVGYLNENGERQEGRQIYDAVFDIRPGQISSRIQYLF